MTTVADITSLRYTNLLAIDSLIDIFPGWNWLTPARSVLYYSFTVTPQETTASINLTGGLTEFNAIQKNASLAQLAYISALTGIRFEPVASAQAADVRFANANLTNPQHIAITELGRHYTADATGVITSYSGSAFVYLDNAEWAAANAAPAPGQQSYWVLLHELGHVLGLKHPFDGNPQLPPSLNNKANTVMSYTDSGGQPSSFGPYDVAALMWLYGDDGLGGALGASSDGRYLVGDDSRNELWGTTGNDKLAGLQGNDTLDGAGGIDTAIFSQDVSVYARLIDSGKQVTIAAMSGADGTDTLMNIERVQFASSKLALDLTPEGAAGKAVLLIGAVLGTASLGNQALVGEMIDYFDAHHSLAAASTVLVDTGIMDTLAGHASPEAYVNLIYRGVMGQAPDPDATAELAALISSGAYTKAGFLAAAAELPLNQTHVGLVGLQQTGIDYV